MALLGAHERLDANRALELGIVSEVVPPSVLRDRAQQLAAAIGQHEPEVLASMKRTLWNALEEA